MTISVVTAPTIVGEAAIVPIGPRFLMTHPAVGVRVAGWMSSRAQPSVREHEVEELLRRSGAATEPAAALPGAGAGTRPAEALPEAAGKVVEGIVEDVVDHVVGERSAGAASAVVGAAAAVGVAAGAGDDLVAAT